jgi:predicted transglutaminase-like cysteine proteinase
MQGRTFMPVFLAIARIFFLITLCCTGAFADRSDSGRNSSIRAVSDNNLVADRSPRLDTLTPSLASSPEGASGSISELHQEHRSNFGISSAHRSTTVALPQFASRGPTDRTDRISHSPEPFDLRTTNAAPGDTPAKWSDLRTRILADERTLAACATPNHPCPDAARRFLSIIELGRQHIGRARLGWINRAVNLSIRSMSDWAQYGYADYWASPLQTLSSGAGDCEDYAIVKYIALRHLGIAPGDLRLLIVRDKMREALHAIVTVRFEQQWLILDNRTMAMLSTEQSQRYSPLFVMDDQGVRSFLTVAARR